VSDNTYKPLKPEQEIVIDTEGPQEYSASVLYQFNPPNDNIRMRSIYVTGNDGYVLGIAYRFMSSSRIYVRVFMPTKQGTPRFRSKDRRTHAQGGMFDAGTSDDVLLAFVRKVAFGEQEPKL
jgi:hypothetical protein